jgi:AcrR family transcriptional regulator
MKNKEIQEKRMKNYFIQATKEILKGEGLQSISVRNVADRAGYSYATLYNYFKDLNDLVFLCVSDFQEECHRFVKEQIKNKPKGIEKLKGSVLAYINYFLEYPGIFELFFLAKPSGTGINHSSLNVISNSLDQICEEDWNYCASHKIILPENVEMLKSQLRFSVIGMLLLYMNRRAPESYTEFIQQTKKVIDNILVISKN